MKLETLTNTHYDELQNNREVLVKIIQNKNQYSSLTCEEIAQQCHISRATLLRVCKKNGLQSFSELKYILNVTEKENTNIIGFASVWINI